MRRSIGISLILAASILAARSTFALPAMSVLKSVLGRYQLAAGIKSDVKKTVTISLLDQTTVSQGELSLSKGRVRLDFKPPHASTIVFDKSLVWVLTPTPKDLGGMPQVLEIKSSALDKESQAPIALLLGEKSAWDLFKVKSQKRAGDELTVNLEKKKKTSQGIQTIQIRVNEKQKLIDELSYTDDLENETSFQFSQTDFSAHLPVSIFRFDPPKNSEITVMN